MFNSLSVSAIDSRYSRLSSVCITRSLAVPGAFNSRLPSNNSVACDDIRELHEFFWHGYEGKGEPYGLINLRLSKRVGRLGETEYPDPDVQGYNP